MTDYAKSISEAYEDLALNLQKRQKEEGLLSFLASVQHFEERWLQVEFALCLQKKLPDHHIWMEWKRFDISIFKSRTDNQPVCIIEMKTVKNYALSYWLAGLKRDFEKLEKTRESYHGVEIFILAFALYTEPSTCDAKPPKCDKNDYHKKIEGCLLKGPLKRLPEKSLSHETFFEVNNEIGKGFKEILMRGYLVKHS